MAGGVVSTIIKEAVVDDALPHPSVAVKVTMILPVAPHCELELPSLLLQVTPEHISDAVAPPLPDNHEFRSLTFPAPSHSTVMLEAARMEGGVVSTILKVATVEEALPQSSVAVKVTVALPVAPHGLESPLKLLLQVTPEQISEAAAPPLLESQLLRALLLPTPLHSTVKSEAAVIAGGVVSTIVNVAAEDTERLPSSVAVNVTVALPVSPQPFESVVRSFDQVIAPQASKAEAPPLFASQEFNSPRFPEPSHSTIMFADADNNEGATFGAVLMVTTRGAKLAQLGMASSVTLTK